MHKISVVIPAYNEEHCISQCLHSLSRQSRLPDEVIVVDNNSTDNTALIAERFEMILPLRVIHEPRKGRGQARATGFAFATGDIIFSTDADTIVPPNWITKFLRSMERKPNIVGVTSASVIRDCRKRTNVIYNIAVPLMLRTHKVLRGHYWMSGCSFAVSRHAYEAAGGFNPLLDAQEDVELSKRISRKGNIAFVRKMPVRVSGRRYKKGIIRGIAPYVRSYSQVFIRKKRAQLSNIR